MVWGPVADRFGRVRALMLTILCYSLFTFLVRPGRRTSGSWRFFASCAGIGIGGEQPIGGTFVAEEWPEDRRKMGAGYMHTGYYFGFFLAALANYFIGANFGWRWMFVLGGTPALLVSWIRSGVRESAAWKGSASAGSAAGDARGVREALLAALRPAHDLMSLLFLVSIIGLWAGSIYVPTAVTQIALREGYAAADAARLASYGTMVLVDRDDPRLPRAAGARRSGWGGGWRWRCTSCVMFVGIAVGFGYVFYLPKRADAVLHRAVLLGLGGANFAMYTLWIPEQYTTECRGSAIGFTSSVGRFVGVGDGVPRRRRHPAVWLARHSRRADRRRVHHRPARAARREGNARQAAPGVSAIPF